jgi:hypothetical protein
MSFSKAFTAVVCKVHYGLESLDKENGSCAKWNDSKCLLVQR